MNYYAVIVAGGTGSRMNLDVPKQFAVIAGRPVIMHTIEAFAASSLAPEIIVVLHPTLLEQWTPLCELYNFPVPHMFVGGGETRFHSVAKALEVIDPGSVVAVHDAVRPLVSSRLIDLCFTTARETGSAVAAVKSRDSVRLQPNDAQNHAVDRNQVYLVQTPQAFTYNVLSKGYLQPYRETFTDDASVVEATGEKIALVEGDQQNFKITFAEDLLLAEALLKQKNPVS